MNSNNFDELDAHLAQTLVTLRAVGVDPKSNVQSDMLLYTESITSSTSEY